MTTEMSLMACLPMTHYFHSLHRTQQFIIKLDLATPELAEVMDKYKIFSREIAVYRDIMPQVNNILGSIGDKTKLAPK